MLTQDSLATLMTGVVAHQPGSLGQPLLIPISVAGSVGGQGGLAVLTFPTATVTTLPGLTAATPAGGVLKLPLTGLQGETARPVPHQPAQTSAPCGSPLALRSFILRLTQDIFFCGFTLL